jgi:hypothetical protein
MIWTVICNSNKFTETVNIFRNAGFSVQLHKDTVDVWESGPVTEYKFVIGHESDHALTLLLLRNEISISVLS